MVSIYLEILCWMVRIYCYEIRVGAVLCLDYILMNRPDLLRALNSSDSLIRSRFSCNNGVQPPLLRRAFKQPDGLGYHSRNVVCPPHNTRNMFPYYRLIAPLGHIKLYHQHFEFVVYPFILPVGLFSLSPNDEFYERYSYSLL